MPAATLKLGLALFRQHLDYFDQICVQLVDRLPLGMPARQARDIADVETRIRAAFDDSSEGAHADDGSEGSGERILAGRMPDRPPEVASRFQPLVNHCLRVGKCLLIRGPISHAPRRLGHLRHKCRVVFAPVENDLIASIRRHQGLPWKPSCSSRPTKSVKRMLESALPQRILATCFSDPGSR